MKANINDQKIRILIVEDQFIEAHDLQLIVEDAGYEVTGIARTFKEAVALIEETRPDLVFLDIFLKGSQTGIDLAKELKDSSIGFIFISANSDKKTLDEAKKTQPYGFIVKPFREQDILTTLEIACFRHKYSLESQLKQELLLTQEITRISEGSLKWEEAVVKLGKTLQAYLPFDYFEVEHLNTQDYAMLGLLRKNFEEYLVIPTEKIAKITEIPTEKLALLQNSPEHEQPAVYFYNSYEKDKKISPYSKLVMQSFGIKSFLSVTLGDGASTFRLSWYSRQLDTYLNEHLMLITNLQSSLLRFMQAKFNSEPIAPLHKTLPKITSEEAALSDFKDMVGNSKNMFTVFDYIRKVSPSDTSVLILGESGTGKEKVAKCIHQLSSRKDRPLIIINCAAIPENLAESILFGHEKGSFTGANEQRIGKFELAEGGTIFLDEIGEMANELQVKLLRVLQEREIERIGGRSPIPINVRIIAATNRNLEEQVASGKFRLDLYYRLHVFPITVPSLRERKDDIIDLSHHFIKSYCAKLGKNTLLLSGRAIETLMNYNWPGNVRELEHTIQRSILMAEGENIDLVYLSSQQDASVSDIAEPPLLKTIEEYEKDYIIYVIKKCNGKISGVGGAAEILDIHPSTLNSRIKKLGIKDL